MRPRWAAVAAAVTALLILPGVALAGGQTVGSDNGVSNYAYLYENEVGDTSNGNDVLLDYRQDDPVADIPHTPSGTCHTSALKVIDDWDNCISSVKIGWRTSTKALCLYDNANGDLGFGSYYKVTKTTASVIRFNIASISGGRVGRDALGRIKWISSSGQCQ